MNTGAQTLKMGKGCGDAFMILAWKIVEYWERRGIVPERHVAIYTDFYPLSSRVTLDQRNEPIIG